MQAVGAARPARNPHAAQRAIGDVLLRYTSQARTFLPRHAWVLAVHSTGWSIFYQACVRSATAILRRQPWSLSGSAGLLLVLWRQAFRCCLIVAPCPSCDLCWFLASRRAALNACGTCARRATMSALPASSASSATGRTACPARPTAAWCVCATFEMSRPQKAQASSFCCLLLLLRLHHMVLALC